MITLHAEMETRFDNNGLGVLDAFRCEVLEELNGQFALEMELAASCAEQITESSIIVADTHRGRQPFRVYRVEKYIDQTVRVYANHLSYDLLGVMIENRAPTDTTAVQALATALSGTSFSGSSDLTVIASARWVHKNPIAAIMGEDENSIINRWGGEVERDGYAINIWQRLGLDRGVAIRYRKNLTGLTAITDMSGVVTRIYPTGLAEDGQTVLQLPERYIDSDHIDDYPMIRARHIHYGDIQVGSELYPDEDAALEALRAAAVAEFAAGVDQPLVSLDVRFIDLSQTVEYANFAVLERVYLGDTVRCYHEGLNVDVSLRVTGVRWDVLRGRYAEITLGQPVSTIAQDINRQAALLPVLEEKQTLLAAAIDATTALLNSPGASYIRFSPSISNPAEMFIMDAPDTATAVNVVRFNSAGVGVSRTGINGPYTEAITGDGVLASAITAGTIGAAVIFAGELYSAHGTFTELTAGDPDGAHMKMGVDEHGDPFIRIHNDDGELQRTISKTGDTYSNDVTFTQYDHDGIVGWVVYSD